MAISGNHSLTVVAPTGATRVIGWQAES